MYITKIKTLCLLFFAMLISIDAFSQLKAPTKTDGNTGGDCEITSAGYTFCTQFSFPIDNLTYDYSNPDDHPCYPIGNFGCDLHIGLTFEGNGETEYIRITKCIIDEIIAAENSPPESDVYPEICIEIPILDKIGYCVDGPFKFTLDLYCKNEFGEFTSVSDLAENDTENSWWMVFPEGDAPKNVLQPLTWETDICCEEGTGPANPGHEDLAPLIDQSDNGSVVYIRNIKEQSIASIALFDANYQRIDLENLIISSSGEEYIIDISSLNTGIYFVSVIDNNIVYSKTIVKM